MKRLLAIALLALVAWPASAQAGIISFRSTVVPNFELTLFDPPYGPDLDGVTLPGRARGYLDFEFELQDGAMPILTFRSVSGRFEGELGGGLTFTLLATGLDTGTATNVQTSGGELTNADLDFSLFFEMYPDIGPPLLVPDTSLPFSGNVSSLPFLTGTLFAGPTTPPTDAVPGSAFIPDPNGLIQIPNAVSVQNRTLTVVPEPGSFAVFGCGIIAAVAFGRRKKAASNG